MKHRKSGTERKEAILAFIKKSLATRGYPPSVREIANAVGLSSTSGVHRYLTQLEESGDLTRRSMTPRAIDLTGENPWEQNITAPLVGTVTAGVPILAHENIEETYSLPRSLIGSRDSVFLLRVRGESMINAGIEDGDIVVVEEASTAENGEIIVALVDEDSATVKRFYREKNRIRLQPENDHMEPIYCDTIGVLGKVIGLYRQMN